MNAWESSLIKAYVEGGLNINDECQDVFVGMDVEILDNGVITMKPHLPEIDKEVAWRGPFISKPFFSSTCQFPVGGHPKRVGWPDSWHF